MTLAQPPQPATLVAGRYRVADIEADAERRLPPSVRAFVAGGAGGEDTVRRNRSAFDRWLLCPRVMADVSHVDPSCTVLGDTVDFPLLLAPTALQRLAHPDGELAAARAAARAGTIMVVSMNASTALEAVAEVGGRLWFQLYCYRDRGFTRAIVERAAAAGYRALCVTVDHPVMPWRVRELEQPLQRPEGVEFANLPPEPQLRAIDSAFSWTTVEWLRSVSGLPIVLKGVLAPQDAARAAAEGIDAIIVSNHGGRQLDGCVTAVDVLPRVVEAVAGRLEVLADGGIRDGVSLLKLIALGARAGLIGRPVMWGLAAGGEAGVGRVLEIVRAEFVSALGLSGCRGVADVDRGLLLPAVPADGPLSGA